MPQSVGEVCVIACTVATRRALDRERGCTRVAQRSSPPLNELEHSRRQHMRACGGTNADQRSLAALDPQQLQGCSAGTAEEEEGSEHQCADEVLLDCSATGYPL
eukprot:938556-Prymnesium_polylepis.1